MYTLRCPKCTTENPEGSRFCAKCAAPLTVTAPQTVPQAAPAAAVTAKASRPVSMWAFFGMMILFSLPVIGFVFCIVMAFAPDNVNIKNYARAQILFSLLVLVLSVIAVVLIALSGYLLPYTYMG